MNDFDQGISPIQVIGIACGIALAYWLTGGFA